MQVLGLSKKLLQTGKNRTTLFTITNNHKSKYASTTHTTTKKRIRSPRFLQIIFYAEQRYVNKSLLSNPGTNLLVIISFIFFKFEYFERYTGTDAYLYYGTMNFSFFRHLYFYVKLHHVLHKK